MDIPEVLESRVMPATHASVRGSGRAVGVEVLLRAGTVNRLAEDHSVAFASRVYYSL
jgi:hypothetical protein